MNQKENILKLFKQDIEKRRNSFDDIVSINRTVSDWMGFELEDENFSDGTKDRGVDFWFQSNGTFDLYQIKTHQFEDGDINLKHMDSSGVKDLQRILELLKAEKKQNEVNKKLEKLLKNWAITLSTKRMSDEPDSIDLNLYLIIVAESLTAQAQEEFDVFRNNNSKEIEIQNVPVKININLKTIDDIITARWHERNQEWSDKDGKKRDYIFLMPELRKEEPLWIPGHNSVVFYCRAYDLVKAFDDFGYQIFEPNVRANIKKSNVNSAIKKSIQHAKSRKIFRFLNNGVTIICSGFTNPSQNRNTFKVTEPGIINGLQTVVSLFDAFYELNESERYDFEENCYVLVRILTNKTVPNINEVVISTNTQNQMQQRNLKSNNEEQVLFEKFFATEGWFYERKQGSWEAFSSDPHRWRSLSRYKKDDFIFYPKSSSRKKYIRKIDNEELAQSWLAFIGFSDEAVNRKKEIFEPKDLYKLAFLVRPKKHSYEYDFDRKKSLDDSDNLSPDYHFLLISYISRILSQQIPISTRLAKEEARNRLNLKEGLSKEEIDAALSKDNDFLKKQVLNNMSFLYIEVLGYILFKALGSAIYSYSDILINIGVVAEVKKIGSFDPICENVRNQNFKPHDIYSIIWFIFDQIIGDLINSPWKDSYLTATSRARIIYSKATRKRIIDRVEELNKYMKKTQIIKLWATSIPAETSLYDYIKNVLDEEKKNAI